MQCQYRQQNGFPLWALTVLLIGSIGFCVLLSQQKTETPKTPIEEIVQQRLIPTPDPQNGEDYELVSPWEEPDLIESVFQTVGFGALPPRTEWIGKFDKAKEHVMYVDDKILCEGCGRSIEECGQLDGHHVISVERIETELNDDGSKKFPPEMKWSAENIIVLCRPHKEFRKNADDKGCHYLLGHFGKSWKVSNPDVRKVASEQFTTLNPGWTYQRRVDEYLKNYPVRGAKAAGLKWRSKQPVKTIVAP